MKCGFATRIDAGIRPRRRGPFLVRTRKGPKGNRPGRVVATRLPSHLAALRGRDRSRHPCLPRHLYIHVHHSRHIRPPWMAEVQILQEQKSTLCRNRERGHPVTRPFGPALLAAVGTLQRGFQERLRTVLVSAKSPRSTGLYSISVFPALSVKQVVKKLMRTMLMRD
jgi:hypothetical protein